MVSRSPFSVWAASFPLAVFLASPTDSFTLSHTLRLLVYSLAVTIWEVFSYGEIPFMHYPKNLAVATAVLQGERPAQPSNMPNDVYATISAAWAAEAQDRPSAAEIARQLRIAFEASSTGQEVAEEQAMDPLYARSPTTLSPDAWRLYSFDG
jgi:Protein tyrosine and serine/threonine kinase